MTAVIIDDETRCLTVLQNDLRMYCPDIMVVESCSSAKEGALAIRRHKPDLLFLDVEMPWMNGFELLETLGEIDFQVIFTTAYDHFAIRAIRMSAVDYLLKPIDRHELVAAVQKAKARHQQTKNPGITVDALLQNIRQDAARQRISVPTRDGYEFIPAGDVIYCHADGAYTYLVLTDGRRPVLSKSLGEVEQQMPEELFVRVHQSYLASLNHIGYFRKGEGASVIMSNGDELSVSKARREQLLLRLGVRK